MRSRCREVAWVAASACFFLGIGACSLFSGWSDLQEQKGASADEDEELDAGSRPDRSSETDSGSTAKDTGADSKPAAETGGGPCNASSCGAQVCCVPIFGSGTCADSCRLTDTRLECDEPSDCADSPSGKICCLSPGLSAQCQTSCTGSNAKEVCDPKNNQCSDARACNGSAFGLNVCQ